MADEPTLYLIWHDPAAAPAEPIDLHGDGHPLADGLWLVRSALSRSTFAACLSLRACTPPRRFSDSNCSLALLRFFSVRVTRALAVARLFASTASALASADSWISAAASLFTASTMH